MEESSWRTELLLSHLAPPVRERTAQVEGLEDILGRLLDEGDRAHAALALPPEVFLRRLADALDARADEPVADMLSSLRAADLYLAAACGTGNEAAIGAFCAELFGPTRASLAKIGATNELIDETLQRLRILLFVADAGHAAQIATYAARGSLRSWVRSIAVRTCRRLMGASRAGDRAADVAALVPVAPHDPELDLLKERYGDQFRAAFRVALAGLTDRERNVLRQHYIDDLSIDKLAALYRVHRATAARWVSRARRTLFDSTRDQLIADLGIQSAEVDSIIRLVRSQLDVSLHDFLG